MLWPHLPLAPLVVAVLCGAAICAVLSRHRSSWASAANASAVFADFVVVNSCVCSIFDLFIVRHLCLVLPPDAGSRARFSSSARTDQGGSVMPLFCGPSLPLNLLIPEVLGPGLSGHPPRLHTLLPLSKWMFRPHALWPLTQRCEGYPRIF